MILGKMRSYKIRIMISLLSCITATFLMMTIFFSLASAKQEYSFVEKWGSRGENNGLFLFPHSIVVDLSGKVYVSDPLTDHIQKFTSNGRYITKWGSLGIANGQFVSADGLATDNSSNVYSLDPDIPAIQKFDSNGKFITKWGYHHGTENGNFSSPSALAIDSKTGKVYVVDPYSYRIEVFIAINSVCMKIIS